LRLADTTTVYAAVGRVTAIVRVINAPLTAATDQPNKSEGGRIKRGASATLYVIETDGVDLRKVTELTGVAVAVIAAAQLLRNADTAAVSASLLVQLAVIAGVIDTSKSITAGDASEAPAGGWVFGWGTDPVAVSVSRWVTVIIGVIDADQAILTGNGVDASAERGEKTNNGTTQGRENRNKKSEAK
jgi:hypothetical protein